ncbi:unnamed protein product [Lymnaea stagnalis]|uniref:DNA mismatch repair protein MSH3 n=1 Tax=Lymnaea stagnalis TaxID=6523 RepID=A0AAV2HAI1_LYMST
MPPKPKVRKGKSHPTVSKFFSAEDQSQSKSTQVEKKLKIKQRKLPEQLQEAKIKKNFKRDSQPFTACETKKARMSPHLVEFPEAENQPNLPGVRDEASCSSENIDVSSGSQRFRRLKNFELDEFDSFDMQKNFPTNNDTDNEAFKDDEMYGSTVDTGCSSVSLVQDSQKSTKYQLQVEDQKGINKDQKYTPLELQYLEIKAQNPDVVLFVECGYKYRFFGDDAQIAADVLKIVCNVNQNLMTASIPVHRLCVHVHRMVAAGYKVGVVKQMETSFLKAAGDNKSGPFTRHLSAVYTKATLIGHVNPLYDSEGMDSASFPSQNILSIFEQSKPLEREHQLGLMCVDPGTGNVIYDEFDDAVMHSELEMRLAHLQPVEIVISSAASDDLKHFIDGFAAQSEGSEDRIRVEVISAETFSPTMAYNTISQLYGEGEFHYDVYGRGAALNLPKSVLICFSALFVYLKEFQLEKILTLTRGFSKFSELSHHMYLNGQCIRNLELFQNSWDGSEKGSLFWILNHTSTRFGCRLLRKWLMQPLLDVREIQERLDAVEEIAFGSCNGFNKLREILKKIPDLERGLCLIIHKKCSPQEFLTVVCALEKLRKEIHLVIDQPVSSSLLQKLLASIPNNLTDAEKYRQNINEHAARQVDIQSVMINDLSNLFLQTDDIPLVHEHQQKISGVLGAIEDHLKDIRQMLNQPNLQYMTVSKTEFLIEVKNSQMKLVPPDWIQMNSTKVVSRFQTPFIVDQYRQLNELKELLVIHTLEAWQQVLQDFSAQYSRFHQAVTDVATLDCLLSLATLANQDSFCKPQLDNGPVHIDINMGRHPILDSLSKGQEQFVPNDTHLDTNGLHVHVISGPNMGGKSSYMRQVALITIMAQIGSYVPAQSVSIGVFHAIYTRMGSSDQIFKHRSTFMMELQETSEILKRMSDRSLVILDELGRGTSTHDGLAIAYATLEYCLTESKCLIIFVTHFPLLTQLQQKYPTSVFNGHMAVMVNDNPSEVEDAVTFLYQLTGGTVLKSYGLNVARLAQLPTSILQRAKTKGQQFEDQIVMKRIFTSLYSSQPTDIQSAVKFIQQDGLR